MFGMERSSLRLRWFLGATRAGIGLLCCEEPKAKRAMGAPRMTTACFQPDEDWPHALVHMLNKFTGRAVGQVSTMILPQVHLRKPCYDFSFL